MGNLFSFDKRAKSVVSEHFRSYEFDCHCEDPECKVTVVDMDLAARLERMHEILGSPLFITSGFRCPAKQILIRASGIETVSGNKISQHELGRAADIKTGIHTGEQLEAAAHKAGFISIGVAKTWIHVDVRHDKIRRWVYKA